MQSRRVDDELAFDCGNCAAGPLHKFPSELGGSHGERAVFGTGATQNRVSSANAGGLIIRVPKSLEEIVRITQVNSSSHLTPRHVEIGETRRVAETHGSGEIAMRILLQICSKREGAIDGTCIAGPAGAIDGWNEVGEKRSSITTVARATDVVAAADGNPVRATRHHNRVWTIAFPNREVNRLLINSSRQSPLTRARCPIEENQG